MGKALTPPLPIGLSLSTRNVVGTSRCDVRAACSGATPSNASAARSFVPPATTRAGTAQRAVPTITLNTYGGFQPPVLVVPSRRAPEWRRQDRILRRQARSRQFVSTHRNACPKTAQLRV